MKYTAGELAKKLGVSARTVRFYNEKKLLIPCGYSDAGYRLYDEESAERLQKIIMLKFMDFSLEQISEMMQEGNFDVRKSLEEQENDLLVPEEQLVFDYVSSYSQHAKDTISKDKERFMNLVRARMNDEGYLYIHKSTGIVVCEKMSSRNL